MAIAPGQVRTVVARTFRQRWETASRPVLLGCDDGGEYVTKGRQAGRMVVNDHVVHRLGNALEAPTGDVVFVDVPQELIDEEPQMQHLVSGIAGGTRFIPNCADGGVEHTDVAENRPRFGLLAVLYGWALGGNQQFIYENQPPRLVHSVDHGHFFPNGPDWIEASLAGASAPELDPTIAGTCGFTRDEVRTAFAELEEIAEDWLDRIIGDVPDSWGLIESERQALGSYLKERRDDLLANLP